MSGWDVLKDALLGVLVVALLLLAMGLAGESDYEARYGHMTEEDRAYLASVGEVDGR